MNAPSCPIITSRHTVSGTRPSPHNNTSQAQVSYSLLSQLTAKLMHVWTHLCGILVCQSALDFFQNIHLFRAKYTAKHLIMKYTHFNIKELSAQSNERKPIISLKSILSSQSSHWLTKWALEQYYMNLMITRCLTKLSALGYLLFWQLLLIQITKVGIVFNNSGNLLHDRHKFLKYWFRNSWDNISQSWQPLFRS